MKKCPFCNGTGLVDIFGGAGQVECEDCSGSGTIIEQKIVDCKEEFNKKFGNLCWDTIMNNAISEEDLYAMIPYIAEYMNIRQSKEIFMNAMKQGLYKYYK